MYFVITGVSRGIGLELTREVLQRGHAVLGVARNPQDSLELKALLEKHDKFRVVSVDLSMDSADQKIKEALDQWPHIDVLINNAGIYLEEETLETFQKSFLINAIKPFFITRSLIPKFKNSVRPVSVQITSQMGSLADNRSGGAYSYRASKAALNMLFKSLSIDEPWLISLLVHPGWVQTRMGGKDAPVTPFESIKGILEIIEKADRSMSGNFLNYQGHSLPW